MVTIQTYGKEYINGGSNNNESNDANNSDSNKGYGDEHHHHSRRRETKTNYTKLVKDLVHSIREKFK